MYGAGSFLRISFVGRLLAALEMIIRRSQVTGTLNLELRTSNFEQKTTNYQIFNNLKSPLGDLGVTLNFEL